MLLRSLKNLPFSFWGVPPHNPRAWKTPKSSISSFLFLSLYSPEGNKGHSLVRIIAGEERRYFLKLSHKITDLRWQWKLNCSWTPRQNLQLKIQAAHNVQFGCGQGAESTLLQLNSHQLWASTEFKWLHKIPKFLEVGIPRCLWIAVLTFFSRVKLRLNPQTTVKKNMSPFKTLFFDLTWLQMTEYRGIVYKLLYRFL